MGYDSYEIQGEIGRGGAGIVHKARGLDGGTVAIKLLKRSAAVDLASFERERRLHETLGEKEGFVPCIESGDSPRGPYLVMPFLPGGTLRSRLARGPLSVGETISLGVLLASALGRAHRVGIVHRDLKPENILYTEGGEPLVADLGLAKYFVEDDGGKSRITVTLTGALKGTAGYMPREQMRDAKSVDARADVFALGAILYECLAGRPAFPGETALETMTLVDDGKHEPLSKAAPGTPPFLASVIERALARDAEARFPDAIRLRAALEEGVAAAERRRALLVLGALAGVAAVLLALVLLLRGPSRKPAPEPETPPVERAALPPPAPRATEPAPGVPVESPNVPPTPPAPPPQPALVPVETSVPLPPPPDPKPGPAATPPAPTPGPASGRPAPPRLVARALWGSGRLVPPGPAIAVAFSPDGTKVFSAGPDGVRTWDAVTGEQLSFVSVPTTCAAFSPDGASACIGTDKGSQLVDLATGRIDAGGEPTKAVRALAFSSDGKRLAVGFGDGSGVEVVEGATRTKIPVTGTIQALVFSKGTTLGIAVAHRAWELWDTKTKRPVGLAGKGPLRHTGVQLLAISQDGMTAALADEKQQVFLVPFGLSPEKALPIEGTPTALSLSGDGKVVAVGTDRGINYFIGGQLGGVQTGGPAAARAVSLSGDGKRVVAAFADQSIRVSSVMSGGDTTKHDWPPTHALAISRDGQRIYAFGAGAPWVLSNGGQVVRRVAELRDARPAFAREEVPVVAAEVSPDGATLIATTELGAAAWSTAKGSIDAASRVELPRRTAACAVAFAEAGGFLLRPEAPDALVASPLSGNGKKGRWRIPLTDVRLLAVTEDGARAVAADAKGTLCVVDLVEGSKSRLALSVKELGAPRSLAWTRDGKRLVGATGDQVFQLGVDEAGGVWRVPDAAVAVAPLPDGVHLASAGADGVLRLRALDSGQEVASVSLGFGADGERVLALTASPEGSFLVVSSSRGRLHRVDVVR